MEPIERFKNSFQEGNLWIYILSLGREVEVKERDVTRLIFEKFGFLPDSFLVNRVLYRLRQGKYIETERFKGKKAYKTTEDGLRELEKMKVFCQDLLQKILKQG